MVTNDSFLVREMRETVDVIRNTSTDRIEQLAGVVTRSRVLFSGEGSSRIFPSKKVIYDALVSGYAETCASEGATQALEYDLSSHAVLAASNSGRTKEVVRLLRSLRESGHEELILVTAGESTPAGEYAHFTYRLDSGAERAVAATKTVVEQALVYDLLFRYRNQLKLPDLSSLADQFQHAIDAKMPESAGTALSGAGTIYWAGRNDGVAEELTLKTNEITRKPADFLEGTYAVHGIEEIMSKEDVVVLIRPFPAEEEKYREVLVEGVGMTVLAIAPKPTSFPTMIIPDGGEYAPYLELAAGWNLLVEIGSALGINLDKPERARKVGNEV